MTIRLTLPYPISTNRYWRTDRKRTPHLSDEAKEYRRQVAVICQQLQVVPFTTTVQVSIELYRPQKSGDLDNFLKVALDALKGFCYLDDKQIVSIHAERYDDPLRPRCEVLIRQLIREPQQRPLL